MLVTKLFRLYKQKRLDDEKRITEAIKRTNLYKRRWDLDQKYWR